MDSDKQDVGTGLVAQAPSLPQFDFGQTFSADDAPGVANESLSRFTITDETSIAFDAASEGMLDETNTSHSVSKTSSNTKRSSPTQDCGRSESHIVVKSAGDEATRPSPGAKNVTASAGGPESRMRPTRTVSPQQAATVRKYVNEFKGSGNWCHPQVKIAMFGQTGVGMFCLCVRVRLKSFSVR